VGLKFRADGAAGPVYAHGAFRVYAVRFVSLDGGLVHAYPPAEFRHGDSKVVSALFDAVSYLFRCEWCVVLQVVSPPIEYEYITNEIILQLYFSKNFIRNA
jgi:hypothetical protein